MGSRPKGGSREEADRYGKLVVAGKAKTVFVAKAYYSRFDFQPAVPVGFSCPGPYDPYLKLVELHPGALSELRGRIRLYAAFAEVGAE